MYFNSENQNNLNRDFKIIMISLFITIAFSTLSVVLIIGRQSDELKLKKLQINTLIDEIGELNEKEIEGNLSNEVVNLKIKKITEDFEKVNNQINLTVQSTDKLNETKDKLQKAEQALANLKNLISNKDKKIQSLSAVKTSAPYISSLDGLFDILILGTNGSFTDTIMTATVNPKLKTINLISFPRDLLYNGRRINGIYKKFGIEKMTEAIKEVSGINPERYMTVDVQAFPSIIDALGGIDITVDKDLVDYQYPGPNFSYITFSITKGEHHLDGETALRYARSRKTTSDFDRAKRQQKVIEAILDKVKKSPYLMKDANKAYDIYASITANMDTDIDTFKAMSYFNDYKDYKIKKDNVLSTSNYLYSTINEGGAYVLLPKNGNYDDIKAYVEKIINE